MPSQVALTIAYSLSAAVSVSAAPRAGSTCASIDVYLQTRAAVEFTHGICPECDAKLYGHLRETVSE